MLVVGSISDEVIGRSAGLTLDVSAWIVERYFSLILLVEVSLVCVHVIEDSCSRIVDLFLCWIILIDSDYWSCVQISIELIICDLLPDLLCES